jgi:regulator of protease activity HflC (stomatin/prohibitin superfamily)
MSGLFIFLGILVLVVSFLAPKLSPKFQAAGVLRVLGVFLLALGALLGSFVMIDAGEVGVKKLFGKVENDVLESGIHMTNPLVDVIKFDVRTQNYTMSGTHDEGDKSGDDAIRALTADGLEVVMDVTILYSVLPNKAPSILKNIGDDYRNVIVRPITRTKMRDNAVFYDAVSLYSVKRDEFQNRIFKGIEADFKTRGLVLEQLLVRNITLPVSVKNSIESKINAEQDAQKMEFVLQKEKQEAERKRVEAQGIADYHKIISSGLTDKQLQYESIKMQKELATSPNSKLIIMGNGGKNTPLILNGN